MIVTITNLKGGVGKSTLTALLAKYIARHKPFDPVVVIDMDPQCGSTTILSGKKLDPSQPTIYDALDSENNGVPSTEIFESSFLKVEGEKKLYLVPSSPKLLQFGSNGASTDLLKYVFESAMNISSDTIILIDTGTMHQLVGMAIAAVVMGVFVQIVLNAGQGAGRTYVLNRIFKYDAPAAKRDVSGGRFGMWQTALEKWSEEPLVGYGLGTRLYGGSEQGASLGVHNICVSTLLQTGLIGSGLLAMTVAIWLYRMYRTLPASPSTERWARTGICAWILTILMSANYGDNLGISCIAFNFWTMVALETVMHSRIIATADTAVQTYQPYPQR